MKPDSAQTKRRPNKPVETISWRELPAGYKKVIRNAVAHYFSEKKTIIVSEVVRILRDLTMISEVHYDLSNATLFSPLRVYLEGMGGMELRVTVEQLRQSAATVEQSPKVKTKTRQQPKIASVTNATESLLSVVHDSALRLYGYDNFNDGTTAVNGNLDSLTQTLEQRLAALISPHQTEQVRQLAPQILHAFLKAGVVGISTDEGPTGLLTLLELCVRLANDPNLGANLVFQVGYGGSITDPSMRFPAYVIAPMEVLREFGELGLALPTVRLFSGQYAAVAINGHTPDEVWPNTLQGFAITKSFIREFYGERLANQVVFDFDQPLRDASVVSVMNRTENHLARTLGTDMRFASLMEIMGGQGNRHGGERGTCGVIKYMALHPLFFLDFEIKNYGPITAWTAKQRSEIITISFGGRPERLFNIGRQLAMELAAKRLSKETSLPSHPFLGLIVQAGKVPVYYLDKNEPAFTSEVFERLQTQPTFWETLCKNPFLANDYQEIARICGSVWNFARWGASLASDLGYAYLCHGTNGCELLAGWFLQNQPATRINELDRLPPDKVRQMVELNRQRFIGVNLQ